jgi:hypothetical protein
MLAVIMLGGIGVLIWYFTRPGDSPYHDIPRNFMGTFQRENCSKPLAIYKNSISAPDPVNCALVARYPTEGVEIIPYDDSTRRFMILTKKGKLEETSSILYGGKSIPNPEFAFTHRMLIVIERIVGVDEWRVYGPCFVDIDEFGDTTPAQYMSIFEERIEYTSLETKFGYWRGFCITEFSDYVYMNVRPPPPAPPNFNPRLPPLPPPPPLPSPPPPLSPPPPPPRIPPPLTSPLS